MYVPVKIPRDDPAAALIYQRRLRIGLKHKCPWLRAEELKRLIDAYEPKLVEGFPYFVTWGERDDRFVQVLNLGVQDAVELSIID